MNIVYVLLIIYYLESGVEMLRLLQVVSVQCVVAVAVVRRVDPNFTCACFINE